MPACQKPTGDDGKAHVTKGVSWLPTGCFHVTNRRGRPTTPTSALPRCSGAVVLGKGEMVKVEGADNRHSII